MTCDALYETARGLSLPIVLITMDHLVDKNTENLVLSA